MASGIARIPVPMLPWINNVQAERDGLEGHLEHVDDGVGVGDEVVAGPPALLRLLLPLLL